ncbi:hypothetical protein [Streptomyces sp. NPDC059063]|uniref:hypothetical protein n=1 Tax=unclassified Streptomyces TaxID=2593676 RepID=UPI0036C422FD
MRRRVRNVRKAAISTSVAGIAAVLVLTGCSSDSDDDGDKGRKDKGAASDSASESPGSGGSGGTGGSGVKDGSLEGSWVSQSGGKPVGLVITGTKASLVGTGQVCNGTTSNGSDLPTIELKCSDGGMERSKGRVESVNSTTMKVAWEGHGTDEFVRAKGGKMPEGLPTAKLPGT